MEKIFDPLSEDSSDGDDLTTCKSSQLNDRNDIPAGETADDKTLETNSKTYSDRVSELEKRRLQLSEKFSRYAGKSNRVRIKKQTRDKSDGIEERGSVTASESPSLKHSNLKPCSSKECTENSTGNNAWLELKPFLTVNDHLVNHCGDGKAKTGLEKRIEEAISKKDLLTAVTLSDKLAERDFGKKIVAAIDAKVYTKKRKLEAEEKAAHHKNKLPWGFEHKQRWETKGNM